MDPQHSAATFDTLQPILFWVLALVIAFCAVATVVTQNIVRAATWLLFTLAGTSAIFFLLGADLVGATQLLVYVGGTMVLVVFGVMLTAQGPFIAMKSSGAEWAISVVAGLLLMAVLMTAVMSPAVSFGPPVMRKTAEVKRFAPEFSRAERQAGRRLMLAAPHKSATPPEEPMGAPPPEKKGGLQPMKLPSLGPRPAPPSPVKPGAPTDPGTSSESVVLGQGFLGVGVGPAHPSGSRIVRTSYLLPFEIVSVHLLVVLVGAAYLARAKRRRGGVA